MRRAWLLLALLPGIASAGENVVTKVSARADGQKTVISVRGSVTPSFTAYRLERPARVVVDVANGRLGAAELKGGPIDVDSWAVSQIAVAEYADDMSHTARVMVGFKRPSSYDVKTVGHELIITVTAAEAPPAEGHTLADASAKSAEERARAEQQKLEAMRAELEGAVIEKQRRLDAEAKRLEATKARADELAQRSDARAKEASLRADRAEAAARAEREKLAAWKAQLETATGERQRALDGEAKRLASARARADQEVRALRAQANAERARADDATRRSEAAARAEKEKLTALRAELERATGDKQRRLDAESKSLEAAKRAQEKKAEALIAEAVRAAQTAAAAERARAAEEARALRAQATAERARAEDAAKRADERAALASKRAEEAEAAARAEQEKLAALRAQHEHYRQPLASTSAPERARASDGDAAFPRGGTHALSSPKIAPVGAALPLQVAGSGAEVPSGRTLPQTGENRARPTRRHYNGRRMDLDFVNADIHNILRLLSDVGQVNIVTSDDVKGTVTIRMHDVPWDQALDVILRSKSLGMQREGNLIRVAPLTVLEKELEAEVARQKAQIELRPLDTRLIPLSYADGNTIMPRVAEVMSPRGHVSVDARTNQLIVTDVAGNIALAEDLVRNLDTQTPQVLIEARIVEARSTFLRDIGVQWGGNTINSAATGNPTGIAFPSTVGAAGGAVDNLTNSNGLQLAQSGAASPNYVVNMPAAVGTGSGGALGITLGSLNGAINVNLRLSSLENTGQVRIISAPKIMTLDNIEASIEQGVSIPISQVSAAGVNTVFVDAKLNLTVKPHVTNEGSVVMNVVITRNEPDFVNVGARGDPTILKKQAKTEMLVRDGDTAVIGGIYTRNTGLSYTKVPWFAEIPILGWLFKNRRENDDRTELLIFITPRIVNRSVVAR